MTMKWKKADIIAGGNVNRIAYNPLHVPKVGKGPYYCGDVRIGEYNHVPKILFVIMTFMLTFSLLFI